MIDKNFSLLEEVLQSLPHKFQKGKNVKIIFEAYLKQYNNILNSYAQANAVYNINKAQGDQLDRIGKNFLVQRNNKSDDDFRQNIKMTWAILKASGNVESLNKVFLDYLNLDKDIIVIKEKDNANIILELNRNTFETKIINAINAIMKFGKPVGVGFSIDSFSSFTILDTYSKDTDQLNIFIDRYYNQFMSDDIIMDNNLFMYDTYYMNTGVDKYSEIEIEN